MNLNVSVKKQKEGIPPDRQEAIAHYLKQKAEYDRIKQILAETSHGRGPGRSAMPYVPPEPPELIPDEDAAIAAVTMHFDSRRVEKGDRLRRTDPFVQRHKQNFHKPQPPPEPLD
jgi:hypothetical protein